MMKNFGVVRSLFPRRAVLNPSQCVGIFHHMPKCGGTALRLVLSQWFKLIPDYITVNQLNGRSPVETPLNLNALEDNSCICGHFESRYNHLRVRYPDVLRNKARRYFLFSFVRDPLQLSLSLYYHALKVGQLSSACSLVQYLDKQHNYMSQRIPCNAGNYRKALGRYDFIGLQEYMSLSVEKLANLLEREPVDVPVSNASPRDEQEQGLSEEVVARFKDRNALDYTIYDYVKKKHLELH